MRRHQDWLFRLAYRITGRGEDAEDAVQEAFLAAYNKLGECRDKRKFGAWLRRIAVNICLRQSSREMPVDEIEAIDCCPAEDPVEHEVLCRAQAEETRAAIAQLPPAYRVVLVLRYGRGDGDEGDCGAS